MRAPIRRRESGKIPELDPGSEDDPIHLGTDEEQAVLAHLKAQAEDGPHPEDGHHDEEENGGDDAPDEDQCQGGDHETEGEVATTKTPPATAPYRRCRIIPCIMYAVGGSDPMSFVQAAAVGGGESSPSPIMNADRTIGATSPPTDPGMTLTGPGPRISMDGVTDDPEMIELPREIKSSGVWLPRQPRTGP